MKKAKTYRLDDDVIALLDALKKSDVPAKSEVEIVSLAIKQLAVAYVDVEKVVAEQFYKSMNPVVKDEKKVSKETVEEKMYKTFADLEPGTKISINGTDGFLKKVYENAIAINGLKGFPSYYTSEIGFDQIQSYEIL